jgi:hypothetical protein
MSRFLLACSSALVLSALIGAASMAIGVNRVAGTNDGDAQAVATDALPAPAGNSARRCPHCGWIEAKREILPDVADPRAQRMVEYLVRRSDGSSGAFRQPLPGSWRVGQLLVLIESAEPLAAAAASGANRPGSPTR